MYEDKSKKRNKRMLIVTIFLIVVSVLALLTNTTSIPGTQVLRDTVANVEYYVIKAPINYVRNVFNEYNDLKRVYRENKRLKQSLDTYTREVARNDTLENEIKELKEMLDLDALTTDYKVKYTTIIERDAESWDSIVKINLGKASEIKKGMAVITSKGMIGTVTQVGEISSTVQLLSSENTKTQLPVMIISKGKNYYGLLNSYDVNNKTYTISLLSDVDSLEDDAKVVTSGLGGKGKSPKGILIGTVKGLSNESNASGRSLYVKPSVDFDQLNYVAVVQRVN